MYNSILTAGALGWGIAQILKFLLYYCLNHIVLTERLTGSGGMPSSHSSMVVATAVTAARQCGVSSPTFALAFIFGAIVMYDAMNVRWAAGEHAKQLNEIRELLSSLFQKSEEMFSQKKLKELLGHKPIEVLCGAILGVIIGFLVPISG